MKIEKEKYDIKKSGDFEELEMKISAKGQEMLIEALSTTLYSNPIGSIVREIASNSLDAHKEINSKDSIEIEYIDKNRLTGQFEPSIIFRDFGPGMSPQRFRETYSNIGESTKSNSNEQIGGFGIGKMTAFAYTDSFTVRTIHDKVDYTYVISRTEDSKIKIFKLHQQDTTLSNRTEIIINLKDTKDKYEFEVEISNQLPYFNNIKYIGWPANIKPSKIDYEDEDIVLSLDNKYNNVHILLGGIVYPINWSIIGENNTGIPSIGQSSGIGLKFNIGDLKTSLNRETIYYTQQTKDRLIAKLIDVSNRLFKEITTDISNEKNLITLIRKLQLLSNPNVNIVNISDKIKYNKANFCSWGDNTALTFLFENIKLSSAYTCFRGFNIRKVNFDYAERITYDKATPYEFMSNEVYYASDTLSTKKSKCIWIKGSNLNNNGSIRQKRQFIIIEALNIDPVAFKTKKEEDDFREQQENMIKILKRDCLDYDNYVIDESVFNANDMAKFYTAAELREQNNAIFAKAAWLNTRSNGTRDIEFSAYEPKVKDIPKHPANSIIYGFAEDDVKLKHVANIVANNQLLKDNLAISRYKVSKEYPKAEILILKINKQNERYFKNRHKGAKHVNDWLMKGTEELIKFYTGYKISEILDKYSYLEYFNEFNSGIYKKYKSLQSYRDKYLAYKVDVTSAFVRDVLMYCEENGVWDTKLLRILAEVEQYCYDLTVLNYIKKNKEFSELEQQDIDVIIDILAIKNKAVTYKTKPLSLQTVAEIKGRGAVLLEYKALNGGKLVRNGYYTHKTPFYMFSLHSYCANIVSWIESLPLLKLDLVKKVKVNVIKNNKQVIKTTPVVQEVADKIEE